MSSRSPSAAALAGALAFVVLLVVGFLWAQSRAEPRPAAAKAGNTVLRIEPGEAAKAHRHAFTLGRTGRITVRLRNPSSQAGVLRVGPPQQAKSSAFDPDPAHAREFPIPATPEATLSWIDLAVGTRVVDIVLETAGALGVDVTVTAAPATAAAQSRD